MAQLRINRTIFQSVDTDGTGLNAEGDMIYTKSDADRLKGILKMGGYKVRVIKHTDFWVVYKNVGRY